MKPCCLLAEVTAPVMFHKPPVVLLGPRPPVLA